MLKLLAIFEKNLVIMIKMVCYQDLLFVVSR